MIACIFICCVISAVVCFALGATLNYNRGYCDGWDDSERFHAQPDAEIKWVLTAAGERLLDNGVEPALRPITTMSLADGR